MNSKYSPSMMIEFERVSIKSLSAAILRQKEHCAMQILDILKLLNEIE